MGIMASRTIYDPSKLAQLRDFRRYSLILKVVVLSGVFTSPFWLAALFFTSPRDYSYLTSLVCVPLLAIVCAAALAHVSQGDSYLRWLLGAGLVAHMAFSSLCLWMGFALYGANLDAFHYWTMGLQVVQQFSIVGWSAFHPPYWSSNLINNIAGFIMLFIGDGLPTLFITFALAALWGSYFFYRAFVIAFPQGDRWLFGILVTLLPSILYWASPLGKDALAQLSIGVACYGFARYARRSDPLSPLICMLGIGGMLAVRAHIAPMLGMGMVIPYAFSQRKRSSTNMAMKILLVPLFLAGTVFLAKEASHFVGMKSEDISGGIERADSLARNTGLGGSSFNSGASLPVRVAEAPFLLFRPFPWEIHNAISAVASIESAGMLLIFWSRRREIRSAIRRWRDPYVGFILIYCLEFSIAYAAATSNFGILVRERIMMVPLALMLVCATPRSAVKAVRPATQKNPWPQVPVSVRRTSHV
jgi:hypothetical protein